MKIPHCLLLLAATLAASSPAHAQPAAATPPAETVKLSPVLVTSDLWESPLARIPASVTVFDTEALRAGSVKHFGDLTDAIPNLTFTGGTSRPRYFQIRGIGENSQFEGETPDSTVRFLVDDLDFTGLGTLGGTFDVRQVEVLRGPQAGAFGANAAGGVVRLLTNAPTPFWTGAVEAGAGGDDLREGGFAVGGPLSVKNPEQFMARLAVHQSNSDGFRRNVTLHRDTNARDEFNARLRLTANPTRELRLESTLLYSDLHNGYDEFALNNNGKYTYSDQPGRDDQRSRAASLRATFTGLPGARLTSVTSVSRVDSRYAYDDDWTAASYMGFSDLTRRRTTLSEELRLDSTLTRGALGWIDRWTLGAFLSNLRETTAYTDSDPANIRGLRTRYNADNVALFGQAAHDLAPGTRLVAGLRTETVDLDGRGTKTRFRMPRNTFDPEVTFRPDFSDTLFGGKVTVEHDLTANQLLFVSATRGYKAGGINIDARISPPADPLTYDTETLWNYEAGIRGNWLDHALTGELTAFYLDRRDTQVRDSAGFGGSYRFFTANAHRAHVSGLEASAAYAVTKELSLHATVSQMASGLDPFTLTNGSTGGGRRLANTPRYGYTFGTRYRDASGFFANAELVARASQLDSNNQNEARRAFRIVNASLGYTWQRWTFTVWGRNVFDQRYDKRVYFFGNEDPDYVETRYENRADPRQLGVSAAYRF
ncbi:MAG: TonB-dependent receptor [Verrucomicrobia bacterium]|nr:TonB-dependent receptor [Verrucomicrobiota bacterium]